MAWGKSTIPKPPPPPRSAFSKLFPLLVLLIVLLTAAFVAYHLYLTFTQISSAASDKIQSKNVVFTKDGVTVGVKELRNERYVDKTQGFLVKAWNLSTWPEYRSRFWNKQQAEDEKAKARKPYSRTSSTTSTR